MSDATPAYRGYRLQTLYSLARILEPKDRIELVFQPEGAEDLAVFDTSGYLLEVIQVKAYSSNLTLSSLHPEKEGSFLYRVNNLFGKYPGLKIKIASFGGIGSDLLKATQEDGPERDKVAQRISQHKFIPEADTRKLISRLEIIYVIEAELKERVFTAIRNLCTGVDPIPVFEMLNFWLYICAESKRKISHHNVIQRINDVGQFIAERNAYHNEWFRSIIPIADNQVDAQTKNTLSSEFYRGISARYDHILANVDKPRLAKLDEITQKFKEKQVVIVHGASGQGKTTLAYRYLHDFFPEHWRFQVQLVESGQHALNIATALSGQARAIGIPMAVYLDVSPNDIGWVELVKQLSSQKNIQVLVTVREEDFNRASISGVELQFSEVELQFDHSEAEEIYQFLEEANTPTQFLDFEDAWKRFGGDGPLMEFVYLITQGNSLRERLIQQVTYIQDEVNAERRPKAELDLLRLVSVASAFEARLKLRELVQFLDLPAPQRTLELLKNEYLLRTSENGALVWGLHPIRSEILADILTDPTLYPWTDSASTCLPLIFEQDVGSFLLYTFSRHWFELEPLLYALDSYQPNQWVAIAGVTHALIWLGIKKYVEGNRQLIVEAYESLNQAWSFVLDFDIADASPDSSETLFSTLAPFLTEEHRTHLEALRNRQIDKSQAFLYATEWLSSLSQEPVPPHLESDWMAMAEVLFWQGRLQVSLPIPDWLSRVDLDSAVETLPMETLADVALGLFYGWRTGYRSWIVRNYTRLINRFRQETRTVVWEDDGQNIQTHFAIELFQPDISLSEAQTSEADGSRRFLNEATERLALCRRFFPDREQYSSRGYGHQIWINAELHDDTRKNIPQSNLPLQWLVSLNATFRELGTQDFRPDTWEEYAQIVVDLRQTIVQVLQQLTHGLEIYFRKKQSTQILGKSIDSSLWSRVQEDLKFAPSLPRCAFDEWGFVSNQMDRSNESNANSLHNRQNLALERYSPYDKAFNGYVRTCSNFFNQAKRVLIINPYLTDKSNTNAQNIAQRENNKGKARLSVINLADAIKTIPNFQEEFQNLLSQFVGSEKLGELEQREYKAFNEAWKLWYFFASHPARPFKNAAQECSQLFNKKLREIRNNIRKELRAISREDLQVSILSEDTQWENEPSLWLSINAENAFDIYNVYENVVAAIQQAIANVQESELRRYAIELTWSNIVIVPLAQGKLINNMACRFSSIQFSIDPYHNLSWVNFIPVAIPTDALLQLKLSTYTHPQLGVAQKLMESISQLSLLVSHIRDFERLPEIDEQGHELLQQYIQQVPVNDCLQLTLDSASEIASYYNQLSLSEQVKRPNSTLAMQRLIELREQFLPNPEWVGDGTIEATMNLSEIAEWEGRLGIAQESAFLIYLDWMSDVLDEA